MSVDASTPNGPRPPAPPAPGASPLASVAGAIRKAAQTTGASFDYLVATAKVESDLNPNLSMKSSSATGLFQFIEQTWLDVMKQAGKALGFGRYADAIAQTPSGRYEVKDAAVRDEIMKLRQDPTANAVMGGAFTQQNAAVLTKRIGRAPTDGELYIAHFFGPYGAAKIINLARSNPSANAAAMFPQAARANQPIFYDRDGNARSIAGVYAELVRRYQVARASPTPGLTPALFARGPAAAPGGPAPDTAEITSALAAAGGPSSAGSGARPDAGAGDSAPVFHSLFRTEDRRGAVSPVVAELWGAPSARAPAQDDPQAAVDPTAPPLDAKAPGGARSPLDLFQDTRPNVRGLFDGSA